MATTRHTAFVTGAGRNIGRGIVLELARRGSNVVINGRSDRSLCDSVAAEAAALGVEAMVLMGDIGDAATCKQMAAAALDRFGTVDILVNNAAIRPVKAFLEMTDEDWFSVLNTDLCASFYLSRAFLPGMVAQNWGRIINFTGMNANAGTGIHAHLSAAKHGVVGMSKALAREFGGRGITVNAISPGKIAPDIDERPADRIAAATALVPVGRLGKPQDIAALCGLLCSDEGSFISGQMIAVNGAEAT